MSGIVDLVRRDAVGDNPANRGEQLLATAIIERKRENELVVLTRELDSIQDGFAHLRWEAIETADVPQLGALTVQLAELAVERFPEDAYDAAHLFGRAAPILGRECPEGEIANAELAGCLA